VVADSGAGVYGDGGGVGVGARGDEG
jgi:hypothetical protein